MSPALPSSRHQMHMHIHSHTKIHPHTQVWKMLRVMKVEEEDLLGGEVPVQLDEENYRMSYQVITDPKFPGQFRIVSVYVFLCVCDLHLCVSLSFTLT